MDIAPKYILISMNSEAFFFFLILIFFHLIQNRMMDSLINDFFVLFIYFHSFIGFLFNFKVKLYTVKLFFEAVNKKRLFVRNYFSFLLQSFTFNLMCCLPFVCIKSDSSELFNLLTTVLILMFMRE